MISSKLVKLSVTDRYPALESTGLKKGHFFFTGKMEHQAEQNMQIEQRTGKESNFFTK